jgi:hypothetical protein
LDRIRCNHNKFLVKEYKFYVQKALNEKHED